MHNAASRQDCARAESLCPKTNHSIIELIQLAILTREMYLKRRIFATLPSYLLWLYDQVLGADNIFIRLYFPLHETSTVLSELEVDRLLSW